MIAACGAGQNACANCLSGVDTCIRQGMTRLTPGFKQELTSMAKELYRVVTRGTDGKMRIKDYAQEDSLRKMHTQIGIDDCSTDLGLRGLPVFRGLIGPMPEGKEIIRYESPEVFETLTKEWSTAKTTRRSRTKPPEHKTQPGG
jgi:hypothetical protein